MQRCGEDAGAHVLARVLSPRGAGRYLLTASHKASPPHAGAGASRSVTLSTGTYQSDNSYHAGTGRVKCNLYEEAYGYVDEFIRLIACMHESKQ